MYIHTFLWTCIFTLLDKQTNMSSYCVQTYTPKYKNTSINQGTNQEVQIKITFKCSHTLSCLSLTRTLAVSSEYAFIQIDSFTYTYEHTQMHLGSKSIERGVTRHPNADRHSQKSALYTFYSVKLVASWVLRIQYFRGVTWQASC